MICRLHRPKQKELGNVPKTRVAYLFSLYGGSIFDETGMCPICAALMSLFCIGTYGLPVILMYTKDVPVWELQVLASVFPRVRLRGVPDIPASAACVRSLPPGQERLKRVLMKLNYWNFTRHQQIMPMDTDILVINPLDRLLTHEHEAPLAAVPLHPRKPLDNDEPWFGAHRPNFFTFNAGIMVVQPDKDRFARILSIIPQVKHCDKVVEQTLLFKLRETEFRHLIELPVSYNCVSQAPEKCKEWDGLAVHIMHFAGEDYKPWRYGLKTQHAWHSSKAATGYISLWHYYHRRFMGMLCPRSLGRLKRPLSPSRRSKPSP